MPPKKKRKRNIGPRRFNPWIEFLKNNAGKGYNMAQLKKMYANKGGYF
jgi:hypothetical protein